MSEIITVLLLIVPVLLVIAIVSYSHKKRKRKQKDKLSVYLHEATGGAGFKPDFQKHLVHQLVLIDEGSRKILVVNHHEDLSHEQLSLDFIKTVKVVNLKETIKADDQKRTEIITKQIGVEVSFEKPEKEIFLVVYDHIEHNIFQMTDLEKEARELQEIITKTKVRQLVA
ncbi:MAG: hypothetical protein J7502_05985 [Flavisolibacter sp.]|nr:hypothetical protein [Flavisolibacter sp.]